MERRFNESSELEIRSEGQAVGMRGYAAVYEKLSLPLAGGLFRERIAAGAFSLVLQRGPDVRALIDHNPSAILGRTKSGTLTLQNNKRGLLADVPSLPNRTDAQNLAESVRRGDVSQMSFGFVIGGDSWSEEVIDGQKILVRSLHDFADLVDVSAVTFAAYPDTDIGIRSAVESAKEHYKRLSTSSVNRALYELCERFAK